MPLLKNNNKLNLMKMRTMILVLVNANKNKKKKIKIFFRNFKQFKIKINKNKMLKLWNCLKSQENYLKIILKIMEKIFCNKMMKIIKNINKLKIVIVVLIIINTKLI